MNRKRMTLRMGLFFLLASMTAGTEGLHAQFNVGNLLVCSQQELSEFQLNGTFIQSVSIPGGVARDIAMDRKGRTHVFNGTFDPTLTTWDPINQSWTHRLIPGWSTVADARSGGIAVFGDFVFLTDMWTVSGPEQGIVRYDLNNESFMRFATHLNSRQLTIGRDGWLYVLDRFCISIFDPNTMNHIDTIDLLALFGLNDYYSIAVDEFSHIYFLEGDGFVRKIDRQGNLLASIDVYPDIDPNIVDVDIDEIGNVIVSNTFGEVFVTNRELNARFGFDSNPGNDSRAYVAFVVEPIRVYASSLNAILGNVNQGKLSDVDESDDSYLCFFRGHPFSIGGPAVWLEFESTLPTDSPNSLLFTIETHATSNDIQQQIEAYNFDTKSWELLSSCETGFNNDLVLEIEPMVTSNALLKPDQEESEPRSLTLKDPRASLLAGQHV